MGIDLQAHGLSPRVRGNLPARPARADAPRSIPACAGEPCRHSPPRTTARVYPRVCGGTASEFRVMVKDRGLSPRVRGNRRKRQVHFHIQRSIPACAGEPPYPYRSVWRVGVYPRVCGGTKSGKPGSPMKRGLSPRVRGNRVAGPDGRSDDGSIPACAGEPWSRPRAWAAYTVYPRVCGGTLSTRATPTSSLGLSPRVRGNLSGWQGRCRQPGSIPACAGEPHC